MLETPNLGLRGMKPMSTNNSEPQSDNEQAQDPDARDVRALTEYLTVLENIGRARHADDLFLVVSQSGSEYLVDARTGACECPDATYRDMRCKHTRRVEFATGERAVPADVDGVDPDLGAHVAGGTRVAVTDGGTLVEERADAADGDERPADCACSPRFEGLPCWPCYRDGFAVPNPDAADGDE